MVPKLHFQKLSRCCTCAVVSGRATKLTRVRYGRCAAPQQLTPEHTTFLHPVPVGCASLTHYYRRIGAGPTAPCCVVLWDLNLSVDHGGGLAGETDCPAASGAVGHIAKRCIKILSSTHMAWGHDDGLATIVVHLVVQFCCSVSRAAGLYIASTACLPRIWVTRRVVRD